jgi:hypothetical protein
VNEPDLSNVLGAPPVVSSLPPDRIPTGQGTPNRLNLFLFQAAENIGWKNRDLPSRDGNGDRISNPKLALNLDYLVTAYGASDFHGDVLLGRAMTVFHEMPVLTRQAVHDALAALPASPLADALAASKLADQVEQLRIIPKILNVEEISKIWTALQAQYRPTAVYQVAVVLIELDRAARNPLPVLTRGRPIAMPPPNGRPDEGIAVQPSLVPAVPTLLELAMPQKVAVRLGETLTLKGHDLTGASVVARFRPMPGTTVLELTSASATDKSFDVVMPPDPPVGPVSPTSPLNPDNWRVGLYDVFAVVTVAGVDHLTSRLPLVLAPRLDSITPQLVGGLLDSLVVTCSPKVRVGQEVVLVVGERELLPNPFNAPTASLTFKAPTVPSRLPSGAQPVRLRVDGIESLLIDRIAVPPRFAPSEFVTLP